jgi:A/G-specific adenine glycosylase
VAAASTPVLDPRRRDRIREGLLGWFRTNARALPWRETRDPYAILVSEVMLQQTQVDRVIPYYERFLERFPTVHDLAAAPVADVIRLWSGLGYNRRAVNLQRAAQAVVERFGGVFPTSVEELRSLPGVGTYTAGAVAAFAFERDVAFLDTNMRRVVTRLLFGADAGAAPVAEKDVQEAARQLVPEGKGWEWNQALIEFGALHCTARNPACVVCPLQQDCAAFPAIQSAITARRSRPRPEPVEPFENTNRYYRGRIVETLRSLPNGEDQGIPLDELGAAIRRDFSGTDRPWLENLVRGLQRDGLAMVAEESPDYDATPLPSKTGPRVRLP